MDVISIGAAVAEAKEYTDSVALGQGAVPIPGPAGKQIELTNDGEHIKWRYVGAAEWITIISISELETGGLTTGVEIGESFTASHAIGGVKPGEIISSQTILFDLLKKMLNPVVPPVYQAPTLTLAGTASGNHEIGENITPTLTPAFTRRDGGDLTAYRLSRDGTEIYAGAAAIARTESEFQLTATVSFTASADYSQGPIKNDSEGNPDPTGRIAGGTISSGSVAYTPRRRAFYGPLENMTPPETSALIRGLANSALNPTGGTVMQTYVLPGNRGVCFAYPATLPEARSIIQQKINMDVKNGFAHLLVNVEGANGYAAESYHVYYDQPEFPLTVDDTYILTI